MALLGFVFALDLSVSVLCRKLRQRGGEIREREREREHIGNKIKIGGWPAMQDHASIIAVCHDYFFLRFSGVDVR